MSPKNLFNKQSVLPLHTAAGDLAIVPAELLDQVHAAESTRSYKKGQILFYEGNRSFGLFYLNSGKVKLYKYTPDGKCYITRIVSAGELMGCRAFFSGESYDVSAEVIEDATVCFLEQVHIREIQAHCPDFGFALLGKMGRELRMAEAKAADIAYKSVPERLADMLLGFKESFGQSLADGRIRLDIDLSREEMASLLGTTVETTVRTLTRFRQLDVIANEKKHIVIKDLGKLAALAPAA